MDKENKTREDVKWLLSLFPASPDPRMMEPAVQALSLLFTANNKEAVVEDLIKTALSGYIATRARTMDEGRFNEIPPSTYFMVSQILMERDYKMGVDNEETFKAFLDRITF